MKLPVPTTTRFSTRSATGSGRDGDDVYDQLLHNAVIEVEDNIPHAEMRRGYYIGTSNHDASVAGAAAYGRGIFAFNSQLFLANHNTLYRGDYSTSVQTLGAAAASLTSKARVNFEIAGANMLVLDSANDSMYTVNTSYTATSIAAKPSNVVSGLVYIDGWTFVADKDYIYNSDLNDPTAGYSDYIGASRNSDNIVHIDQHEDHVVAFGGNTIEFFYVTDNAAGSPLKRRDDIFYNVGIVKAWSVSRFGNDLYFAGVNRDGGVGIYRLSNFQLTKVSEDNFDAWLTSVSQVSGYFPVVTAFEYNGRPMVYCNPSNLLQPYYDGFVLDAGKVYLWQITGGSGTYSIFDPIGFISPTELGFYSEYMMLSKGDVVINHAINDATTDTFTDKPVATSNETAITMKVQFPSIGKESAKWKFCQSAEVIGRYETGLNYTLKWRDWPTTTFNTGRTATKAGRGRVRSLGRFSLRDFRIEHTSSTSANYHPEVYGLELDITRGSF